MASERKRILSQDDAYDLPQNYRVFVEDECRFAYDQLSYPALEEVIEEILAHISSLRADGIREWDLVVWQECRVVAVIRTNSEDEPSVTLFN